MPAVHRDHVVIDVIAVRVVQVTVVEIVEVLVVAHRDVSTPFGMDVLMFAFMNGMCHVADRTSRPRLDQAGSHGTHSQTASRAARITAGTLRLTRSAADRLHLFVVEAQ
jgi:ribosomal protein L3